MGGKFGTACGAAYPPLPELKLSGGTQSYVYTARVPVVYGHYWRQGRLQTSARLDGLHRMDGLQRRQGRATDRLTAVRSEN
jgi:hypothetical protein